MSTVLKKPKNANSKENRDVISLFSGAMGLDIGLEQAGLNVKIGQDSDSACVATIKQNGRKVLDGDVRALAPETLLECCQLKIGSPFLICGGPPCQPFSTAGKREGINDPRGSLFMDFIRMIDFIRPRFFIMENVKGLLSARLSTDLQEKKRNPTPLLNEYDETPRYALEIVLEEFEKLGYKTLYGLLDAVNYGVPQFRERFVLLGSRDAEEIFLPIPTHFPRHQNDAYRWQTLRSAIEDLENAGQKTSFECASFGEERSRILKLVPEGGNWRNLPPEILPSAMGGAYSSGGGKVGFYRRLAYDQPSPTLVASPIQKASMLCHPTSTRPLSVKEYARIQQFPDDWNFAGSVAAKYRQIGNAVPVGLGKALGEVLLAVARGASTVVTKRFRGTNVHKKIQDALELGYEYARQQ